ncbi:hypothetical protein YC2023_052125 [Brassica napus]
MEAKSTAFSGPIPRLSSVKDTSSIRLLNGLSVECRKFGDVSASKAMSRKPKEVVQLSGRLDQLFHIFYIILFYNIIHKLKTKPNITILIVK